MSVKLLFVVKNREFPYTPECDGSITKKSVSSGLYNSVKFVTDMLQKNGVDAVFESAIDNNCLDRLLTIHKPTHIILEALWVVPSKIELLKKLHPKVKWVVRLHSEVPFIANEGIAMEWLYAYDKLDVLITANSPRMCRALELVMDRDIGYTPNYYPVSKGNWCGLYGQKYLDIGCFGAVRPLKNHLIQAKAAIAYANMIGKPLRFHINNARVEGNGDPVLKNLRFLFEGQEKHQLIEHGWLDHADFKNLVSTMDAVLQVSYTETYNIVIADAVSENVPVVTSDEIRFIHPLFVADPNDIDDIISKLARAIFLGGFGLQYLNRRKLIKNSERSVIAWKEWISSLE